MSIGRITRVELHEVWKHEALEFTAWLEDNTDVLDEVVDFTLVSVERKKVAGDLSVELVGEDENGQTVIIESQLGKSTHDHLGKLLTYQAAIHARAAIWIVARPRPEHVKAIAWLNEVTSTSFYLLQVEAIRIGDSPPAPLLTRIVGPSREDDEDDSASDAALAYPVPDSTDRFELRKPFWSRLLVHANGLSTLHEGCVPNKYSRLSAGVGIQGLKWTYGINRHTTRVELSIDRGSAAENTFILQALQVHQAAVETAFGGPLEWVQTKAERACQVRCRIEGGGWGDAPQWPVVIPTTVDAMLRLEAALRTPLAAVKRELGDAR